MVLRQLRNHFCKSFRTKADTSKYNSASVDEHHLNAETSLHLYSLIAAYRRYLLLELSTKPFLLVPPRNYHPDSKATSLIYLINCLSLSHIEDRVWDQFI